MARRPKPPTKPTVWRVYKLASKAVWLGDVEATDEREAIEKVAREFRQHASKLIAVRK